MKFVCSLFVAGLAGLLLIGCGSTGGIDDLNPNPLDLSVDTPDQVTPVDPGALLTTPSTGPAAEVDPLAELNTKQLSQNWSGARSADIFMAMGNAIKNENIASTEDLRYAVMKFLGRPDTSSLLSSPSFLAYNLPDGRTAQVSFPSGSSADWEVFGTLKRP